MSDKKRVREKGRRGEIETAKFVRSSKGKVLTAEAGIFKIRGIGESKRSGGYSTRKHEIDR